MWLSPAEMVAGVGWSGTTIINFEVLFVRVCSCDVWSAGGGGSVEWWREGTKKRRTLSLGRRRVPS